MVRELFPDNWETLLKVDIEKAWIDLAAIAESIDKEKEKSLWEVIWKLNLVRDVVVSKQDTILELVTAAAKNPEAKVLSGIIKSLERLRAIDKKLREKLLVPMMAKEEGWPAAEKLQRRLDGEYVNPPVPS